jgi:hypothetical protein
VRVYVHVQGSAIASVGKGSQVTLSRTEFIGGEVRPLVPIKWPQYTHTSKRKRTDFSTRGDSAVHVLYVGLLCGVRPRPSS